MFYKSIEIVFLLWYYVGSLNKEVCYMIKVQTVSSMDKIMPHTYVLTEETQNTILSNEQLNFQLAIYNDDEWVSTLNEVTLTGTLAKYAVLRTVELMPASYCPVKVDDYYISHEPGMYPDLLKPYGKLKVTLPAKQWRSVWVSVSCKDGLPVGKHVLNLTVLNSKGESLAETSYKVEVLDKRLPDIDIPITNWMHYDCIADKCGAEPFTKEYYKAFDKYLDAYLHCGNTMLLVPLFTPPLDTQIGGERRTCQLVKVYKNNGKYSFDFSALEYFIAFVLKKGVKFLEFSHLFTQWGGKHCPKIIAEVDGETKKIFGWEDDSIGDEYACFLDEFLPKLAQKIDEWGVRDISYFHLTDEPHKDDLETYGKCRSLVKKHIGNMPIMDALSCYDFYKMGLVDIAVVGTGHYAEFTQKQADDIFAYYCCLPTDNYFCNRLLNMPLQRTRICGFALYQTGSKGFLHWGFNFYNTAWSLDTIDPYADTSAGGMFPAGDSFVVYPAKDEVLLSIRAEAICEGLQDYRLCKLAESKVGRDKVKALLLENGIEGYNIYPKSISAYNSVRRKLIDLL